MNWVVFSFAMLIGLVGHEAKAETKDRFVEYRSFSFNEVAPIRQIHRSLKGDAIDQGDEALTSHYLESGKQFDRWTVSAFMRYDYLLKHSPDITQLIYEEKNDIPFNRTQRYRLDMTARHVRGGGLKAGYRVLTLENFTLDLDLSYLFADGLAEGELIGDIAASDDNRAEGQAQLDYFYTKDVFFKRKDKPANGHGASLDLAIIWQPLPSLTLGLTVKDMWSRVYWRDQNHTRALASSDNIQYDDDGQLNSRPLLSWVETQKTLIQTLPRTINASIGYRVNTRHGLGASLYRYADIPFYRVHYDYLRTGGDRFLSYVDLAHQIFYFGYETGAYSFGLGMDHIDYRRTKSLDLQFAFRY